MTQRRLMMSPEPWGGRGMEEQGVSNGGDTSAMMRRLRSEPIAAVASRILERAERLHREGFRPRKRVQTGLSMLDEVARSWWGVTLLGGDRGVGTTTLAARTALETARAGGRVLWFGLAHHAESPVFRMLTGLSGIAARRVFVDRALSESEFAILMQVGSEIGRLPIELIEAHGAAVEHLRASCGAALRSGPIDLVVLDPVADPDDRLLAALEHLADDLDVPLLAVAGSAGAALTGSGSGSRPPPLRPGSLRLHLSRTHPAGPVDEIAHPGPGTTRLWVGIGRVGEEARRVIELRFLTACRWLEEAAAAAP